MKTGKTSGLIATFSALEKKEFVKYLSEQSSPSSKQALSLFHAYEDTPVTDKKKLFTRVFGQKKYEDKKLRYLHTELNRHATTFLAVKSFLADQNTVRAVLSKTLSERGAEKAYYSVLSETRKKAAESELMDASLLLMSFQTEFNHLEFVRTHLKRSEEDNLQLVADQLDKFYLARKLQLCCEMVNVKNVLSGNRKIFLFDEVLEEVKKGAFTDVPAIRIYYQILMTLLSPEVEDHFNVLRTLLLKHAGKFTIPEQRDMYQYLLNYCIRQINLGNITYQKTLFEIYQVILKNNVLMPDGYLSQWDYKNIVTLSLRLREYKWTKEFITSYEKFLPASERKNAFVYNMAYWNFHSKNYPEALSLLQKVSFSDLYYQLDTRVILLKIYYEQDDLDALFYHLTAFRTFLRRNRLISEYQRTIYSNLIAFTSRLARNAGNKKMVKRIAEKIRQTKQTADLQWLLEKVKEVE